MNGLTIIIIAHNEAPYVELAVESIRMFADVEDVAVVLVDNHSTDGLREWGLEQEDITYVYLDEKEEYQGRLVNQVCRELEIQGDIMLMSPHYLLTPNALSKMKEILYSQDNIGAVGPVSNGLSGYQSFDKASDYENAIEMVSTMEENEAKTVLGLDYEVIMICREKLDLLNGFNEELVHFDNVMRDFGFSLLEKNFIQRLCKNVVLWNINHQKDNAPVDGRDFKKLEEKWGMHYFNTMYNENLIGLIKKEANQKFSVLEIGCDCGATLLEIKNRFPQATVYGSELNENAAKIAAKLIPVEINNIENKDLKYKEGMFDYIIFGDVLEHLREPLEVIKYCKTLLKHDGCIIASIPNVMHISVIENLMNGDFTYTEMGLLDKTHIHLFTFNEIVRMFENGGYKIEDIGSALVPISNEQNELIEKLLQLGERTERFMYETFQYVLCAKNRD